MRKTNLMIGLVAAAALTQVSIGAANAAVSFTYVTTNTVSGLPMSTTGEINGSGGTDYFLDTGTSSTTKNSKAPTDITVLTLTPEKGATPAKTVTFSDTITPTIQIFANGGSGLFTFSPVSFTGTLSNSSDTAVFGPLPQTKITDLIGGYSFTVSLVSASNPGTIGSGSVGTIQALISASPAPEPSEIATLGFLAFGLLGLMIRARKASSINCPAI